MRFVDDMGLALGILFAGLTGEVVNHQRSLTSFGVYRDANDVIERVLEVLETFLS